MYIIEIYISIHITACKEHHAKYRSVPGPIGSCEFAVNLREFGKRIKHRNRGTEFFVR